MSILQKMHQLQLFRRMGHGQETGCRRILGTGKASYSAEKTSTERWQAKGRAMAGGPETGPNLTDRGKPGSKHHVMADAKGTPLAMRLTGAKAHGVAELIPLVDDGPIFPRVGWSSPEKA